MIKYKNKLAKVGTYLEGTKRPFKNILVQDYETLTYLPMTVDSRELEDVYITKEMKLDDYIQILENSYFYSDTIQEYMSEGNSRSGSSFKSMMQMTLVQASKDNVWIEDLHESDYESIFDNIVKHFKL